MCGGWLCAGRTGYKKTPQVILTPSPNLYTLVHNLVVVVLVAVLLAAIATSLYIFAKWVL